MVKQVVSVENLSSHFVLNNTTTQVEVRSASDTQTGIVKGSGDISINNVGEMIITDPGDLATQLITELNF